MSSSRRAHMCSGPSFVHPQYIHHPDKNVCTNTSTTHEPIILYGSIKYLMRIRPFVMDKYPISTHNSYLNFVHVERVCVCSFVCLLLGIYTSPLNSTYFVFFLLFISFSFSLSVARLLIESDVMTGGEFTFHLWATWLCSCLFGGTTGIVSSSRRNCEIFVAWKCNERQGSHIGGQ